MIIVGWAILIAAAMLSMAVVMVGMIIAIVPYIIGLGLFLLLLYALGCMIRSRHRANQRSPP